MHSRALFVLPELRDHIPQDVREAEFELRSGPRGLGYYRKNPKKPSHAGPRLEGKATIPNLECAHFVDLE